MDLNVQNLKRTRQLAGLTQSQLAEKIGVHVLTVTRYETGKITPRPATLHRLGDALGVDPSTLVMGVVHDDATA